MWRYPTNSIAVISDVHANLEALTTVLNDIEDRGVNRIVSLGDIIGYGPNPVECLDLVMEKCEWSLMGNHDFAVLFEPTSFNGPAQEAVFWTRAQFDAEPDPEVRRGRWNYLGNLPVRRQDNGALWVHASPRRPINEYIFPDDVFAAPVKMQEIFQRIDRGCFVGHTHVQGVFIDEPDFFRPGDIRNEYTIFDDEKYICNPGSVGQPRDGDPRAAYAIIHEDRNTIQFVRLEYDIQTTFDKIKAVKELSNFLADRLWNGQ